MTTPLFHLTLPGTPDDPAHLAPVQILLECLAKVDQWLIRRSLRRAEKGLARTVIPPLRVAGVTHRPWSAASPDWLDVRAVQRQGGGAEESLVAWRAAELRITGVDAEPVVGTAWIPGVGWCAHFCVRHPDGRLEDVAADVARRTGRPPPAPRPLHTVVARPLVHLSLPETEDGAHFAPLQIALEGLTQLDQWQIERARTLAAQGLGPEVPPLYASGVRYAEEPPGHEDWLDVWHVLRDGEADCEDLAAYLCAELRADGVDAEPVIKWQWVPRAMMIQQGYPPDKLPARGVWLVHCCVRMPDGTVEDPSKRLGMGGNFMERI